MHSIPLFDLPEPEVAFTGEPTGRRGSTKSKPTTPQWTKYRPKQRVACDDCLADLVAAGGGPVARAARFRRIHQGVDRLLCSAHMTLARQLEGLDPMDDADGALR